MYVTNTMDEWPFLELGFWQKNLPLFKLLVLNCTLFVSGTLIFVLLIFIFHLENGYSLTIFTNIQCSSLDHSYLVN